MGSLLCSLSLPGLSQLTVLGADVPEAGGAGREAVQLLHPRGEDPRTPGQTSAGGRGESRQGQCFWFSPASLCDLRQASVASGSHLPRVEVGV